MTKAQAKQLVVCVENDGYAVSLEKRKIYVALRDAAAEKHNMLRIVDESGEDYLYPKAFFPFDRAAAICQKGCAGRLSSWGVGWVEHSLRSDYCLTWSDSALLATDLKQSR
jgi:hypothetical protein